MSTVLKSRPAKQTVRPGRRVLNGRSRSLAYGNKAWMQGHQIPLPTFSDISLSELRTVLGWSRNQLAQLMNASDRAIVNWEKGAPMSPVYAAKFREIQGIYHELGQSMQPAEIGPWLLAAMDEFQGRSPVDLISKGETGRLWASLFYLRSGMPD